MAHRDQAKQYFLTGNKPTQGQFHQLLDWLRFSDEKISMNDINDLVDVLQDKADVSFVQSCIQCELQVHSSNFMFEVTGGRLLERILIQSEQECYIQVGTADGLDDVVLATFVAGGSFILLTLDIFSPNSTRIYFSGFSSATQFRFLSRFIYQP